MTYQLGPALQAKADAAMRAAYINDGRARCPRCAVVLNDERRPADFTDHMSGINLCPDCQSNEAERLASTR